MSTDEGMEWLTTLAIARDIKERLITDHRQFQYLISEATRFMGDALKMMDFALHNVSLIGDKDWGAEIIGRQYGEARRREEIASAIYELWKIEKAK